MRPNVSTEFTRIPTLSSYCQTYYVLVLQSILLGHTPTQVNVHQAQFTPLAPLAHLQEDLFNQAIPLGPCISLNVLLMKM
jgi:hypothetical protein